VEREPEAPEAPEDETQAEIRSDAAHEPDDPITHREEVELDLMEEEASEEGEHIGEHID
jgi:hypothetical protein